MAICSVVERLVGITPKRFLDSSATAREVSDCRTVAVWVLKNHFSFPRRLCGEAVGLTPSAVHYALHRHDDLVRQDKPFRQLSKTLSSDLIKHIEPALYSSPITQHNPWLS